MTIKPLCQLHQPGESCYGNDLTAGGYLAAVQVEELPAARRNDYQVVEHGYGVGLNRGGWYFFVAVEPAVTFGRAARTSHEVRGYGVYPAAREQLYCQIHRQDETVLHLLVDSVDRSVDEVQQIGRFAEWVKEHPQSSAWRSPGGPAPAPDVPHVLYRFFDAKEDGNLLYVGLTMNPGARWKNHSKEKPWWLDVRRVENDLYPSRAEVEAAERAAIIDERPLHNVVHNRAPSTHVAQAWPEPKLPRAARRDEHSSPWSDRHDGIDDNDLYGACVIIHNPIERSMWRDSVTESGEPYAVMHGPVTNWTIEVDLWTPAFPGIVEPFLSMLSDFVSALMDTGAATHGGYSEFGLALFGLRTAEEARTVAAVVRQLAAGGDRYYRSAISALNQDYARSTGKYRPSRVPAL